MRIPKTWIAPLAKNILDKLVSDGLIENPDNTPAILAEAETAMLEELMLEDRLNDEVREILKKFGSEIDKGRLDYKKLFDMTKQKLIRERNLVI